VLQRFADACSQLKFSVAIDGTYVAEEVPRQVGIRAGAIVQGFVRFTDNNNNVHPLRSNARDGSIITLGQLATAHSINLDQDILVMEKKTRYCTNLCKLDTKEYGLPQTRNRKYLFGWKSDDPDDDLGIYIDILMGHLKTPLLYPMDAFLLPETHDRIRCFREALRSGPGLMVKRERAMEPDFWDWELSQNLDTPRHMVFRQIYGIAERSRWMTRWDTRGRKTLPPGCWPELFDCWNMRRLDLIDCFASAAVRDPISRDPLHHSFVWDLSQNVTRTQYRTATVGVSGCVTPGGELFLPHKGRTLMGYEKLLLQGIPFSRLRLGHESEVQLSDLAGNAMSVSVISATLLAAICAPELRRQQRKGNSSTFRNLLAVYRVAKRSCQAQNVKKEEAKQRQKVAKIYDTIRSHVAPLLSNFRLSQKHDDAGGRVIAQRGDLHGGMDIGVSRVSFTDTLRDLVCTLAEESYRSSVLCTCESSGAKTKDAMILECKDCGMSICHHCTDRHQTESHKLRSVDIEGRTNRSDPHVFERKLRCAVPSLLRLGQGWSHAVAEADGLEMAYGFQLQQIDRKRGFWELIYGAWEDFGSGRQVAEIRVRLGRIGALYHLGAVAHLRCFAPSIRHNYPHRGNLGFNARLIVDASIESASWEIVSPENDRTKLCLTGRSIGPSHRVQVGLTDIAYDSLEKHAVKTAYKPRVVSRNSLTTYHKMWKQWPNEIEVNGNSIVAGTYHRLSCRHTVVHSALWRRDRVGEEPDLYILIRPDVVRSGLDTAVISRTPSYRDIMEVCELEDWIPENALVPKTHTTTAKMIAWTPRPELVVDILSPAMKMTMQKEAFHESVCRASAENSESILCRLTGLSRDLVERLLEYKASNSSTKTEIDVYGKFGTRNAKQLSIVAAPSLEKYAASNSLPLTFSEWYNLPSTWSLRQSELHVPKRPVERWKVPVRRGKDMVCERYYDPEESHMYYLVRRSQNDQILSAIENAHQIRSYAQRLLRRPLPFRVTADPSQRELIISMNPSVAAYNAVDRLGGDKSRITSIQYSLAELSSMGEPGTKEFKVPNSDSNEGVSVVGLKLPLYTRQSKALSRMIAIERGDVLFAEEERSEHLLPGIGWCMIAKATKKKPLPGGVLGDAIGSGKTVIAIALILQGVEKARNDRDISKGRSGASLVVVPPGLVQQWDDERQKFTGSQLTCIKIQSLTDLKGCTVKQICEADMIIVPAGIIEEAPKPGPRRPYTEHLTLKAGLVLKDGKGLIPPAPTCKASS
jgi:site-specific DNA-cytosine methylase